MFEDQRTNAEDQTADHHHQRHQRQGKADRHLIDVLQSIDKPHTNSGCPFFCHGLTRSNPVPVPLLYRSF